MEQELLSGALSTSILISLAQGLFIYVLTRSMIKIFPDIPASQRFNILYTAIVLIFTGFIASLIRNYCEINLYRSAEDIQLVTESADKSEISGSSFTYSFWISLIYLAGLFTHTLIIAAGFYKLIMLRSRKDLWFDKNWDARLAVLASKLNITGEVRLNLAERTFSPFTAGFLKPVIFFPIAMINRLSIEQVEAILLHELAHIKRNDYLLNIFLRIIEAIMFFNPFIWLISKELKTQREFSCDDLVIQHINDPGVYAYALLHIAESKLKDCRAGVAATGGNKYQLFNRITRITSMKTNTTNPKQGLIVLLTLTAICLSVAWIVPANKPKSNNEPLINKNDLATLPDTTDLEKNVALNNQVTPAVNQPVILNNQNNLDLIPSTPPVVAVPTPMPVVAPVSVIKQIPPLPHMADTNEISNYFKSPEWKKEVDDMRINALAVARKFDSPEWKKEMEELRINALKMARKFDSPEWKKEMENLKINAEALKKQFDSPEWKKEMENLRINSEALKKKFDSPEWKAEVKKLTEEALENAKKAKEAAREAEIKK